jgi:ABC-2 type transport system ATP-binding protein
MPSTPSTSTRSARSTRAPAAASRRWTSVSFQISPGEFFGLLGPNGAGKTTLISVLAGLARATGGRVTVMGHDVVADYAAARKSLGIVPQELVFDPFFSVRETLRIQSGYFGVAQRRLDRRGAGRAGPGRQGRRQHAPAVSGGMKRRVLVAQALVHRPPVIVLDEPTAGVDVELRQTLWRFIARLNREGHTVLLTTHYLEEAEALCGRIAMLKQGRVVALDKTSQLLAGKASTMLRFKTDGALPPRWPPRRGSPAASCRPRRATRRGRNHAGRAAPGRCEGGRPGDRPRRPGRRVPGNHAAGGRPDRALARTRCGPGEPVWGHVLREARMSLAGAGTLFRKEVLRFWKVAFQTVAAPVLTAIMYLLIFGHVLQDHVQAFPGVGYTSFLVPGLVMMSVLQNAFANSSSSLIQSKITGNLVFLLVSPLSHWAWFVAYVGASMVRGLVVGGGVMLVTVWFAPLRWPSRGGSWSLPRWARACWARWA